jgi:hypothetical protein
VEEFRWPLELAAGSDFGRDAALGTTAQLAVSLAPFPSCGGVVSCCVCCSCALFVSLCVVAFASARDVRLLLLLN